MLNQGDTYIHIIGPGVVGKATGEGFRRFGFPVIYTDKEDNPNIEAFIHFICTPEEVVPQVVEAISRAEGIIVIRSTLPPGTTNGLAVKYQRPIFHNPEFLRERTAEDDFLFSDQVLLGISQSWDKQNPVPGGVLAKQVADVCGVYAILGKRVILCTCFETEMIKLATNNYLAMLISFWNEVKGVCDVVGVNSHRVAALALRNDGRIQSYGAVRHGESYGGRCLPKDVKAFLSLCQRLGVPSDLMKAVQAINQRMGGE